jgi:predicted ATP-binding protein involved in virulence
MFIDKIAVRNFKGFEDVQEFKFKSAFTCAIGNNGLGKSTLLNALQVGLGGFLQSVPNTSGPKYRRQFKGSERYQYHDKEKKSYESKEEKPFIAIDATYQNEKIDWMRVLLPSNETSHNQRDSGKIIDFTKKLFETKEALLPVLANFETNRVNAQVGKMDKAWKRTSRVMKGYYSALNDTVNFKAVYEWLESYEKGLKAELEFDGTRSAFYTAIKTAIPYIDEIEYTTGYGEFEVMIDFKDGQTKEWKLYSNVSDGMKAMLNMVSEIAYRCIMLNGSKGKDAVILSPGVVLIDELDMHLHPNWQKHVVKDLRNAFPSIQFIVTTHSPFIVQSLSKNQLIVLDGDDPIVDPFKRGIEDVSEDELNVTDVSRSEKFKERVVVAAEYYKLIAEGKTSNTNSNVSKLREQLNLLENRFSEDPIFVGQLQAERKLNKL